MDLFLLIPQKWRLLIEGPTASILISTLLFCPENTFWEQMMTIKMLKNTSKISQLEIIFEKKHEKFNICSKYNVFMGNRQANYEFVYFWKLHQMSYFERTRSGAFFDWILKNGKYSVSINENGFQATIMLLVYSTNAMPGTYIFLIWKYRIFLLMCVTFFLEKINGLTTTFPTCARLSNIFEQTYIKMVPIHFGRKCLFLELNLYELSVWLMRKKFKYLYKENHFKIFLLFKFNTDRCQIEKKK